MQNEKKRFIIKSNDLESSFDAINLIQKAYLKKSRKIKRQIKNR